MIFNQYVISILRKGATKRTIVACQDNSYLSLCQILESTDDVEFYEVAEMDGNFQMKDIYMAPKGTVNHWPKWRPIQKGE